MNVQRLVSYLLAALSFICLIKGNLRTISEKRDINLAIYLSLCLGKGLKIDSLMLLEGIDYKVNIINKEMNAFYHGRNDTMISMGYVIYDVCYGSKGTLKSALDSVLQHVNLPSKGNGTCCVSYPSRNDEVIIVANASEAVSSLMVNLLQASKKPYISLYQYKSYDQLYKNYYKLNSQDYEVLNTFLELIKFMKWTHVGLIFSNNPYGEAGYYRAIDVFNDAEICFSFSFFFSNGASLSDVDMIKRLKGNAYIDVVLLWLTADTISFLQLADRYFIYNRTWLASPAISNLPSSFFQTFEPLVVQGMIHVKKSRNKKINSFFNYFWKLEKTNVINKWRKYANANVLESGNGTYLKSLQKQIDQRTYVTLYNTLAAFDIFRFDLKIIIGTNVKEKTSYIIEEVQRKPIRFGFINNADTASIEILQIDYTTREVSFTYVVLVLTLWGRLRFSEFKKSVWAGYSERAPNSKCHGQCLAGHEPIYVNKRCCWICVKCADTTIKSKNGSETCQDCPHNTESNRKRTLCFTYKNKYIIYNTTIAYGVYSLVCLGAALSFVFLICFVKNRTTPLVRSSNTFLSITQLTIHFLLFLTPVSSIGYINNTSCIITMVLHGQLICLILAIVFAKTVFLVRVFQSKRVLIRSVVTKNVQYLWILSIQAVYGCLVILALYHSPHGILNMKNRKQLLNEVTCANHNLLICQFAYILFLTASCMVQAFRARNLPSYYNEGTKILYASSSVIFVLIMAALLHTSITDINKKVIQYQVLSWLINFCILFFMFSFKVWVLMFQPQRNNIRVFRRILYNNSKERVDMKMRKREGSRS
ncbi:extracellular calcium-sensing receptor-like [Hydractinia symbiolongicarpus]|uniref:extracellular calcium-sensing receptor-like n=1 Tax=Hydractinia symbiolongicarpus TaxID=13093 RepID=UPI002551BD08|nr:extracellular calcium-sensing receptor-like [Hydractinia symbiolongicarpus]